MLTLDYILRLTDPRRKWKAANLVKILQAKQGITEDPQFGPVPYFAAKTQSVKEQMPNGNIIKLTHSPKYLSMFTIIPDRKKRKVFVKADCSCFDFRYRWDYALHAKDGSDLLQAIDQPPVIRNPQMKTAMCKHLVLVATRLRPQLVMIATKFNKQMDDLQKQMRLEQLRQKQR